MACKDSQVAYREPGRSNKALSALLRSTLINMAGSRGDQCITCNMRRCQGLDAVPITSSKHMNIYQNRINLSVDASKATSHTCNIKLQRSILYGEMKERMKGLMARYLTQSSIGLEGVGYARLTVRLAPCTPAMNSGNAFDKLRRWHAGSQADPTSLTTEYSEHRLMAPSWPDFFGRGKDSDRHIQK